MTSVSYGSWSVWHFLWAKILVHVFNENVDYKKNYTSYYVPEAALIESHSFAKNG